MKITGKPEQEKSFGGAAGDVLGALSQSQQPQPTKAMDEHQVNAESGGRQFDANGRTLVGRRSDGSLPRPSERAYGVAQIQVGTARDTARKHGIPWDENRLMNDADYNRRLGDLHMQDLRQRYNGDNTLALAAYHSGVGNVDEAIRQHGRQNFVRGLGRDGRSYVRKLAGSGETPGADLPEGVTTATPAPELPQARAATQQERDAMAVARTFDVSNPMTAGTAIGTRYNESDADAMRAVDVTDAAIDEINRVQTERLTHLEDVVAEKQVINDQRGVEGRLASERARSIFARRHEIESRRDEMDQMNPVARFFKGLTNMRYNESAIDREEEESRRDLADLTEEFNTMNTLTRNDLQNLQTVFEDNNQIFDLREKNAEQDVVLANRAFAAANLSLKSAIEGIDTQMGIEQAQQQVRAITLGRLTEPQALIALEEARTNGTEAIVNGIALPLADLEKSVMGHEELRISSAGMKLGFQNQQLAFADTMETRAIEAMTSEQAQEALNNNGILGDTQYSVAKLGARIQQDAQARMRDAALAEITSAPGQLSSGMTQLATAMEQGAARAQHLSGSVPGFMGEFGTRVAIEAAAIRQAKDAAIANGTINEVAAQLLPRLQALQTEYAEVLDRVATDWAGNNRSLRAVGRAWMGGGALSTPDATQALVTLARDGLPPGVDMTDSARRVFTQAQQFVQGWDQRRSQQGLKADDAGLARALSAAMRTRREQANADSVIRGLPLLARNLRKPDGTVSPIARISSEDWQAALNQSDLDGERSVAEGKDFGGPVANLRLITAGASEDAITVGGVQYTGAQRRNLRNLVSNAQTTMFLNMLDNSLGEPGQNLAYEYQRLLRSESFYQAVNQQATQLRGVSIGDFLIDSVSGPAAGSTLRNYGTQVFNVYTARRGQALAQIAADQDMTGATVFNPQTGGTDHSYLSQLNGGRYDPAEFSQMLRGTITRMGVLTAQERNLFLAGLNRRWEQHYRATHMSGSPDALANARPPLEMIDQWILRDGFTDPTMESLRKKIKNNWQDAAQLRTHN